MMVARETHNSKLLLKAATPELVATPTARKPSHRPELINVRVLLAEQSAW